MAEIAKIAIYGDIHLSSKNYGGHKDYIKESLDYFTKITEIAEENKATHIIGLGDLTFGRFNTLEYRLEVEKLLSRQYTLTNGNRYELCGNHDIASYGKTERDFYIDKGIIKKSQNISFGNIHITMIDYGKTNETEMNIVDADDHVNIVLSHNYYKFSNSITPNFGTAINIDELSNWFGVDYIICGHIHKQLVLKGTMTNGDKQHEVIIHYPGCSTRPAYREGMLDENGQVIILTITDDNKLIYDVKEFKLWDIKDSFNIDSYNSKKEKEQEAANKVDLTDVVKQLDAHDIAVGDPTEIIASMENIDQKYKDKAIDLLKRALG